MLPIILHTYKRAQEIFLKLLGGGRLADDTVQIEAAILNLLSCDSQHE